MRPLSRLFNAYTFHYSNVFKSSFYRINYNEDENIENSDFSPQFRDSLVCIVAELNVTFCLNFNQGEKIFTNFFRRESTPKSSRFETLHHYTIMEQKLMHDIECYFLI